jgi:plastocyanin
LQDLGFLAFTLPQVEILMPTKKPLMGLASRRVTVLVLVLLVGATPLGLQAAQPTQTVEIKDFVFTPQTIVVQVGTTVVWRNKDIVPHTATAQDITWDVDEIRGGAEKTHQFMRPGRYPYRCRYHPAMQGVIEVQP